MAKNAIVAKKTVGLGVVKKTVATLPAPSPPSGKETAGSESVFGDAKAVEKAARPSTSEAVDKAARPRFGEVVDRPPSFDPKVLAKLKKRLLK